MNTYLYPYKMGSKSAALLSRQLGVLRVNGSKTFKRNTTIINWGSTDVVARSRWPVRILNKPSAVLNAKDKLRSFNVFKNNRVPHPEYTTNYDKAVQWLSEGSSVYCRTTTTSYGGNGIAFVQPGENLVAAPLYTKKFICDQEYRVHVFKNEVFDFSLKRKRREATVDINIRNFNNGWVFCRDNISLPVAVKVAAIQAVYFLDLDFGAVDVVYNSQQGVAKVLEVNTAPGLEGTTLVKYTNKFQEVMNARA